MTKQFPQYAAARTALAHKLHLLGVDIGHPRKVTNLLLHLREKFGPVGKQSSRQMEVKIYYDWLVLQRPLLRIADHIVEGVSVKTNAFLLTRAWRKLRYTVLKRLGAKCQCCGRDKGVVIHVDHIKSRSKYPELALDESNLQVLCEDCNVGKGAWDETDWR